MLLLMAASAGFGFFSGSVRTLPWMAVLSLAIVGTTAVLALASGSSWLAAIGFAFGAGAAFQISYVMATIRQEAVLSRTTRQDVSPAVQG